MLSHSDKGIEEWVVIATERNVYPPKHGCDARITAVIQGLRLSGYKVFLIGSTRSTAGEAVHLVDGCEMVDGPIWEGRGVHTFKTGPYEEAVWRCLRGHNVVAVMVEYLWMVPILRIVPEGISRIVDTHDLMYVTKDLCGSIYHWIDISKEDEGRILSEADIVLAIQGEEAEEFRGMVSEQTEVVGLGHPVEIDDSGCDETAEVVMIVGSDNPSNKHGMGKFLKYWPKVVSARPNAELRVYGNLAYAIRDCENMVRYGFFHDLGRAYAVAKVIINPSEVGTGLKIKTVEAMAKGKAVVVLENGAAGIDNGLSVCDDHEAMADEVIRLLGDDNNRRELQKSAVDLVRQKYSRDAVFASFLKTLSRTKMTAGEHHILGDDYYYARDSRVKNEKLAFWHWLQGAKQGAAQCAENVAWAYRDGIGVKANKELHQEWHDKAHGVDDILLRPGDYARQVGDVFVRQ